jgi:hypothetical protein
MTGTLRLANQPAGVFYTVDSLSIGAVDTFTVAPSVPLRVTGPISVSGTWAVTGGGRFHAADAGAIVIEESGILSLTANAESRLIFGAENAEAIAPWAGIEVNGQIDGGFITVRGGALSLNRDFGDLEGMTLEAASGPLSVNASGNLLDLDHASEMHPIIISSGAGRVTGRVSVGGDIDLQFTDLGLCDSWDLSGLVRVEGGAARTNCP